MRSRQDPKTYPGQQRFHTTVTLWRQQSDGTQRELGRFPSSAMMRIEGNRAVRLRFGGTGVVTLWRDGFCTGSSSAYAFACFDAGGRQLFSVRHRDRIGRTVTAADRALVFEVDAKANPGPEGAPQRDATRRNARFANRLPAFGRLLATDAGEVWVGPASADDETVALSRGAATPTRWSVYANDGRWSADVMLPATFLPTEVGNDWVAGVRTDADGVQQAVVLTLRRGG